MQRFRSLFFFTGILYCLLSASVPATDKPTITWLSTDWEPIWIRKGPLADQGYAQSIERLVQKKLPNYTHKNQRIVSVRTYSILKTKESCFSVSAYKGADLPKEQRKGLLWSAPNSIFFYHGLIAHNDAVPVISRHMEDGYVNLASLVGDENLIGLYQPGRVYSRWITPILSNERNQTNLFRWSSNLDLAERIFRMLKAKRMDYTIDYSFLLKFHEETSGEVSQYTYLPLLEHRNTIGLSSFVCKDSEIGRALIRDINKILIRLRKTEEYKRLSSRWLIPKGYENLYWDYWQTALLPLEE